MRTLEQSEFYVADTPAILAGDPTVALYVATILARRLDAGNRWLVAVKRQLQTDAPPSVIGKAVEKVEELLSYGGRDPTGWRSAPIEAIKGRTDALYVAPDGLVNPGRSESFHKLTLFVVR